MVVLYIIIAGAVGLLSLLGAVLFGVPPWVSLLYYAILGVGLGAATISALAGIAVVLMSKVGKASSGQSDHSPLFRPEPTAVRILAVGETTFFAKRMPEIVSTSADAEVRTARSEAEALKFLASDPGIDCLVLDPTMPRETRIAFCRQIRAIEAYVTTPVIISPADSVLQSMRAIFRAETEGLLSAPSGTADWCAGVPDKGRGRPPLANTAGGMVDQAEERSVRAYRHANALI